MSTTVIDGQARIAMQERIRERVRQEEREARERQRARDRLQRSAEKHREREAKGRIATVVREELAKPRSRQCRCGIKPWMSMDDLMKLGSGCTAGRWVCPTLDAIRRRLGK